MRRFPAYKVANRGTGSHRHQDAFGSDTEPVGTVILQEHVTKKVTKEIPIKLLDKDGDTEETIRIYRAGIPYLRFTKSRKRWEEDNSLRDEYESDFLHEISVFSTENPLPFLKFGYSFGGGRAGRNVKRQGDAAAVTERPQPVYVPKVASAPAAVTTPVPDLESCLLYTSPSPRDRQKSRMPSSA